MTLSPETLAGVAGVILSLVFSYVPQLKDKFSALDTTTQRLIMVGLLFCVAIGVLLYQCRAEAAFGQCVAASWEAALKAFLAALVSNQATFLVSPKPARTD